MLLGMVLFDFLCEHSRLKHALIHMETNNPRGKDVEPYTLDSFSVLDGN